jgi:ABC-type multidrug transport system fused ATPase/permease subunit
VPRPAKCGGPCKDCAWPVHPSLDELLPGTTRVIVSHKVASVRGADRIAVLHDGRVVEEGTHEALLALGGRYAATFEQQAVAMLPSA